jgi:hypothetical protein
MASAKKCDRGNIFHGSCRLLPNIHKGIFKNFKPHHFFVEEGSEIYMDSRM